MSEAGVGGGGGKIRNLNIKYSLSGITDTYDAEVIDPKYVKADVNADLPSRTMTTCGLPCNLHSDWLPT